MVPCGMKDDSGTTMQQGSDRNYQGKANKRVGPNATLHTSPKRP